MCPICLFELSVEITSGNEIIRICAYCGHTLEDKNGNRIRRRDIDNGGNALV
jgi:hypothetical protein